MNGEMGMSSLEALSNFFFFLKQLVYVGIGICGVILVAAAIVFLIFVFVLAMKRIALKEWGNK